MTLILTATAALVATVLFLMQPTWSKAHHVSTLALMYWGASLMWCVDGLFSLAKGNAFVELKDGATMTDDALLGACVIVLGLAIWAVCVAILGRRSSRQSAA